jgi:Metallo-peptidase family M12B Reprolysin-like
MTVFEHATHESLTTHRQRRSVSICWAGIVLAIALLLPRAAAAAPLAHRGIMASEVYLFAVQLNAGTHTFRIRNATAGTPMLHVYKGNSPSFTPVGQAGTTGQVTFTVSTTGTHRPGTYEMMVRATTAVEGRVDFQQGTTTIAPQVSFGGITVPVPTTLTGSVTFETALRRAGATETILFGLDANNGVIYRDGWGGVGLASRFVSTSSTNRPRSVVVATRISTARGLTDFYINPTGTDSDGDGLGNALETELQTCPNPTCPNAAHGRDTDRDGLTDMMEIFGVDHATVPQMLPVWGADPRHKDVFVETDWAPAFATNPFSSSDAALAAIPYDIGTGAEVGNPDGQSGIRLHIDNGIVNPDRTSGLFGNWGGANRSSDSNYNTAPDKPENFNPIRKGIFHYGLFTAGSGGQGPVGGFKFYWGGSTSQKNMHVFTHELGHNLGLDHHGHGSWGGANCKPHYQSLMNYAYSNQLYFSRGQYSSVNLKAYSAQESQLFGTWAEFLSLPPFSFITKGTQVDWNRDGLFQLADDPMRAPVVWAPGIFCDGFSQGRQQINWGDPNAFESQPPSMLKAFGHLYVFYADQFGNLSYQAGEIGGVDANGSCGAGTCATWFDPFIVPTVGAARAVSAIPWGGGVLLVYQVGQGFYSKYATTVGANGELTNWSSDTFFLNSFTGPDLSIMQVDPARFGGASEVAGLFWSDGTYYYQAMKTSLSAPWTYTWVMNLLENNYVTGRVTPTVASFPNRGVYNHASIWTSCGTFTDMMNQVRFYCYDKASNKWREHTEAAFSGTGIPVSTAKTALTYHVIRKASGAPRAADATWGQWMLIVDPSDWRPRMYLGNASSNTDQDGRYFTTTGPLWHEWALTRPGVGITLYEDETISAPKAAGFWQDVTPSGQAITSLHLFPFADGTTDNSIVLKDGNDFHAMERVICMSIKNDTNLCGVTTARGY